MSRKRKLYLSELIKRYNEINDLYQIEIFPKKEVYFWEVNNEYIGIFLK